ncbi:MAG: TlpA family protein disulfide reductase [Prevotella sp.]|nr:TlpA family protein disulfide reductase [Prevotella sp.]
MKRKIITSLFALCAIASQAQNTKNSSSAPLDSIIIEGVVTYMTDGARLNYLQEGVNAMQETIVKDGKFRIAISQKEKESVLHLIQFGPSLDIYTEIGKKIKVIGDDAHTVTYWHVESDNFNQKENNAYNLFIQEKLPEFYEADNKYRLAQSKLTEKSMSGTLTQEDQEKVIPELRALIQKVDALRKEKYNAAILDFMKERPFSKRMIDELWGISISDHTPSIVEKTREIFKKIPQEAMNEPQVVETKAKLNADRVQVGEHMKDFTLFDREGNKHQLSEFKGKYTILEFTERGCGGCIFIKPFLEEFYKRNKDKAEIIAIYYDTKENWIKEGQEHKVSYHEWSDNTRSAEPVAAYDIKAYPTFVIIDPNGKILDIKTGGSGLLKALEYIPDAEVEKKLKEALKS